MARRPAFLFYPRDWLSDPALGSCSPAARGLWVELLCLMWECEPRGQLAIRGAPIALQKVRKLCRFRTQKALERCLKELQNAGVFVLTPEGIITSPRMIRDEAKREQFTAYGKTGGNPTLRRNLQGVNPRVNGRDKAGVVRKRPSSSSSAKEEEEIHTCKYLSDIAPVSRARGHASDAAPVSRGRGERSNE